MKPEVEIYDTTLRDGSQGEGINFSVMDKLRIAEKLDAFGIHYIEGGWPGSNPKDIEFFAEAQAQEVQARPPGGLRLDAAQGCRGRERRPGPAAARSADARGHDLRQDLAAAREGSPADDARGEPGDDRRHGALPQGPRQVRHLRRRARLRRIQGRPRIRPGDLAGGGEGRARISWCCATPTAGPCRARWRPSPPRRAGS